MVDDEIEDAFITARKEIIKRATKDFPVTGEFTAGQYRQERRTAGSVYVPDFKVHMKFTNIKPQHFKPFFDAFMQAENSQATEEGRDVDDEKLIAYAEYLLACLNGWSGVMYNRVTNPFEGFRASSVPASRPSWRERRAMKKQGGW